MDIIEKDIKNIVLLTNSRNKFISCMSILDGKNIDLHTFGNELDSVYKIQDYDPSIIIVDIDFSKTNSHQYLYDLKDNYSTNKIPVFIVGSQESINVTPLEVQWIAQEIILSPVIKEEFELTLNNYINTSNKIDDLGLEINTTLDLVDHPILILKNHEIIFKNELFKEQFKIISKTIFDLAHKSEHSELKNIISTILKMDDISILKSEMKLNTKNNDFKIYNISFGVNPMKLKGIIVSISESKQYIDLNSNGVKTNITQLNGNEEIIITEREKEVLILASRGYNSNQIGDKLYISYRTVERHRSNLLKKLNSNNLAQALTKAIKNKLISI